MQVPPERLWFKIGQLVVENEILREEIARRDAEAEAAQNGDGEPVEAEVVANEPSA